jgi:hypothetical protein
MNKDPQTISKWTDLAREAICYYLCENSTKIGGINRDNSPKIEEIDESMFFRHKYNRGRITHCQWFVGGMERGKRNCFMRPVSNRNATTMIQIVTEMYTKELA